MVLPWKDLCKKNIYIISGLDSWLRKCTVIERVLIKADNQAVRGTGRSRVVHMHRYVVGVKETNNILFVLLFSVEEIKLWFPIATENRKLVITALCTTSLGFMTPSVVRTETSGISSNSQVSRSFLPI